MASITLTLQLATNHTGHKPRTLAAAGGALVLGGADGPGYPLIRLQALHEGPVSAAFG